MVDARLPGHGAVRRPWLPPQFPGDEFTHLGLGQMSPVQVHGETEIGPVLVRELADDDLGAPEPVFLGDGEPKPAVDHLAVRRYENRHQDAPPEDVRFK